MSQRYQKNQTRITAFWKTISGWKHRKTYFLTILIEGAHSTLKLHRQKIDRKKVYFNFGKIPLKLNTKITETVQKAEIGNKEKLQTSNDTPGRRLLAYII